MRSIALPCRRPSRRCNVAIRCPAHRTATSTARNAARRCRPCTRLLYSRLRRMVHPSHSFSSPRSLRLMHRTAYIPQQASLPRIATRRQFPKKRLPHLFASSQPSSRLPASRVGVPRHITFCWKENNGISKRKRSWAIFGVRSGSVVAFGFRGKCARPCPRDGASALPWRGTHFLQLHFHHTWTDLQPAREYSLDRPPYVFARR